jgi:pyruvate dehydrogenase E2 component (dihydrolipoamide acetyltransferase)
MSKAILMPKLGLTMTEGEIVEWKVAPGDRVNVGDILFVIETDKTSTDVEALDAGVIETLLASAGETVPVGAVVATLTQD